MTDTKGTEMHDDLIPTPYGLGHRLRVAHRRLADLLGGDERRRTWILRLEGPDVRARLHA